MSREVVPDGSGRPDWRAPAVRVGLEIALIVLIAGYLSIHLSSPFLVAIIVVSAIVGSIVLLFRTLDRQAYAWVRYASDRTKESQRKRKHEREKRRRQQQQAQQRGDEESD